MKGIIPHKYFHTRNTCRIVTNFIHCIVDSAGQKYFIKTDFIYSSTILANILKFTEEMCYKELVQNEGFVDIIGIFVACVKI